MNLNKGISTPVAIIIIVICAVLVVGAAMLFWSPWTVRDLSNQAPHYTMTIHVKKKFNQEPIQNLPIEAIRLTPNGDRIRRKRANEKGTVKFSLPAGEYIFQATGGWTGSIEVSLTSDTERDLSLLMEVSK